MQSRYEIALARADADIQRCFAVMQELRPHLTAAAFLTQVKRQMAQGYCLAFLEFEKEVRAAAGYRISEHLAWAKICYVDDLVTRAADRSQGHGGALFDWLVAEAVKAGCSEFHLDSGVQRFGAHRFYLAKRMEITSHHFALKLTKPT
jgi:GNAT superfamily N-acetyltransferase